MLPGRNGNRRVERGLMSSPWYVPGEEKRSPLVSVFRFFSLEQSRFSFSCPVFSLSLHFAWVSGLMILYYVPPAGKESIIPLGIASASHGG